MRRVPRAPRSFNPAPPAQGAPQAQPVSQASRLCPAARRTPPLTHPRAGCPCDEPTAPSPAHPTEGKSNPVARASCPCALGPQPPRLHTGETPVTQTVPDRPTRPSSRAARPQRFQPSPTCPKDTPSTPRVTGVPPVSGRKAPPPLTHPPAGCPRYGCDGPLSRVVSSTMSGGSGAAIVISFSVPGCVNRISYACRACRVKSKPSTCTSRPP